MLARPTFSLCVLLIGASIMAAQIPSSQNSGCTAPPGGGMGCNGIGTGDPNATAGDKHPILYVDSFTVEPAGVLDGSQNWDRDVIIVGKSGGSLDNGLPPGRPVSLSKDQVTLLPKGQPYRLVNNGSDKVELLLITIRR